MSVRRFLWGFIAACGLVPGCIGAAHGQGLTIAAITVDGQPAKTVTGVQLRTAGAAQSQAQTLNAGQAIAAGTEITLPRGARIELTSSNDNRIIVHPGARFVAGIVTARGESHQPLGGRIEFHVRKALDFFNVEYERITASVKGTEYTVDIDPAMTLTISVAEGAVEIERPVQIRVADTRSAEASEDTGSTQESGIRIAEVLQAGQRKTYRLNLEEYLAEFKTFAEAEAYFKGALAEAEAAGERRATFRAVLNLMEMYWKAGRMQPAIQLEDKCVQLAKALFLPAGEAQCFRHAGFAYHELGEYRKAIGHFEKSIALHETLYPSRDTRLIASNLHSLGLSHMWLRDYRRSVQYLEKAQAMWERLAAGRDDRQLALNLSNLGRAYDALGEHRTAIAHHERALATTMRLTAGRDHRDTGIILTNFGVALAHAKDFSGALKYHQQALALSERLFAGRDSVHTAAGNHNVGLAYLGLGEHRTAIGYLEKALAMRNRVYGGRDHVFTSQTLGALARAYRESGDRNSARQYAADAAAMRARLDQKNR